MAIAFRLLAYGSAMLRCKIDPFLSLDCAPTPSNLAQSKERKGSNFAIWQPWYMHACIIYLERRKYRDKPDEMKRDETPLCALRAAILAS